MKLQATEGRLIIKLIEQPDQTESGILLAKPQNPDLKKGTVVSVGGRKKDQYQKFNKGDVVSYQNYSGCEFEEDGEKYLIINQSDILAVEPIATASVSCGDCRKELALED